MDKNLQIALVICLFVVLVIALLPGQFQGKGYDYYFHYAKAKGLPEYNDLQANSFPTTNYPPLFHWAAQFFSFREESFYSFTLFFLGLILPLTLFFLTRHWVSVLFYFSATSFFYFFETGVYPQALAIWLMLLMLYFKSWPVRIALILLGILAHSTGFYLLALTAFLLFLKESKALPFFPFACSGYFPEEGSRPNELLETEIVAGSSSGRSNALNFGNLTKFLVEIFPLPFALMAINGFWMEKNWHLFLLFLAGIIGGLFDYRIFYVSAIVGLIGLTDFYKRVISNSALRWRIIFFAFCLIYAGFQFFIWFRLKFYCYPLWIVKPIP